MANEPPSDAELLERTRQAALDTLVQQLRLIHEMKKGAPGPCPQPSPGRIDMGGLAESVRREGTSFLSDLVRQSLTQYEQWVKFGADHFDFIADSLRRLAGKEAGGGTPRLELTLQGRSGETRSVRFVVDNPYATKAEVRFSTPVFLADDRTVLPATVAFQRVRDSPGDTSGADFSLEGCKSGRFELTVSIAQGALRKDNGYHGESSVFVGNWVGGLLQIAVVVEP